MKYITVQVGMIITRIAIDKGDGYSVGVLECFLLDNDITHKERIKWIRGNNKRMEAICNFLNRNNL